MFLPDPPAPPSTAEKHLPDHVRHALVEFHAAVQGRERAAAALHQALRKEDATREALAQAINLAVEP